MNPTTLAHPKVALLARRLRVPKWGAVGLLESLWCWASMYAHDGDIGKHREAWAVAIGWVGQEEALFRTLVDTGWLDVGPGERSLLIHDWEQHRMWRGPAKEPKRAKAVGTSATTAPDSLTPEQMQSLALWCGSKFPDLAHRVGALVEACLDFHRSKGNRHRDWVATCRTWIRNEDQRYGARPSARPGQAVSRRDPIEAARNIARGGRPGGPGSPDGEDLLALPGRVREH